MGKGAAEGDVLANIHPLAVSAFGQADTAIYSEENRTHTR